MDLPTVGRTWYQTFCFLVLGGACIVFGRSVVSAADDIIMLEPFEVSGNVRSEIVGFTVTIVRPKTKRGAPPAAQYAHVWSVYPNTAAERAELAPGDHIVSIDGDAIDQLSPGDVAQRFRRIQRTVGSGRQTVVTLVVEAGQTAATRQLKLAYPADPPRWGIEPWQPPSRTLASVGAEGIIAQLARTILNNGVRAQAVFQMPGDKVNLRGELGRALREPSGRSPCGYKWQIKNGNVQHCMLVVQRGAATEIILSNSRGFIGFISVDGVRREGWLTDQPYRSGMLPNGGLVPVPDADIGALFEAELDVWRRRRPLSSSRWPL